MIYCRIKIKQQAIELNLVREGVERGWRAMPCYKTTGKEKSIIHVVIQLFNRLLKHKAAAAERL